MFVLSVEVGVPHDGGYSGHSTSRVSTAQQVLRQCRCLHRECGNGLPARRFAGSRRQSEKVTGGPIEAMKIVLATAGVALAFVAAVAILRAFRRSRGRAVPIDSEARAGSAGGRGLAGPDSREFQPPMGVASTNEAAAGGLTERTWPVEPRAGVNNRIAQLLRS